MLTEIRASLRPALTLLLVFTLITGLAYPLAVTGIAQVLMPWRAGGSLIEDKGHVIGSQLIGQRFTAPGYFHGRPSAAGPQGYDAAASAGSNLAPGAAALRERVSRDMASLRREGMSAPIPGDLVTTSASGLDPDISLEGARAQVARVAASRKLPQDRVRALVEAQAVMPVAGLFDEPRVNVLSLNRQLDRISAKALR